LNLKLRFFTVFGSKGQTEEEIRSKSDIQCEEKAWEVKTDDPLPRRIFPLFCLPFPPQLY
jgi:hypothetical protein